GVFRLCCCCISFLMLRRQPSSTFFPYTTLFRSCVVIISFRIVYSSGLSGAYELALSHSLSCSSSTHLRACPIFEVWGMFSGTEEDRKSTRLNSSHVKISYAVFCLKKKKYNHSIY